MTIVRYYLPNALAEAKRQTLLVDLQKISNNILDLKTEKCFHIEIEQNTKLSQQDVSILKWILKNPQDSDNLLLESQFVGSSRGQWVIEIGPRFNFSTADSSNSVSICQNVGLQQVVRIETSIKYLLSFGDDIEEASHSDLLDQVINLLGDRMTQCRYTEENLPKLSFYEKLPQKQEPWYFVPVMQQGRKALEDLNEKMGLAFDNWDLGYYTNLFQNVLKRNPTSVELFDCAQSNSEHSRHWFFRGKMFIDRQSQEKSLIQMIINTQKHSNQNNTIKFSDNSSAIKGYQHKVLRPLDPSRPGAMHLEMVDSDLIFTAETHNMPTAVAPFSGATTGTGGRIRDVQGVGRGGLTIAGTAGYCVGALNIPNYDLPYESKDWSYPPSFASPLKIIIEASNGASDYGNKFGEPVITGFAISYGCLNGQNERDEYVKPIMFSGGLGTMDATQTNKIDPKKGMLLAKIGGPVYRIGVGGGAASSVEVQGDNSSELDFNAVQRGDAEMENKVNRVVRACIEMGDKNPILAIHDQGAGGNGNVLKELVEPGLAGAIIFTKEFQLGDPTITALELWGAEYQENNAVLCKLEDRAVLEAICQRERCPLNFVGVVSGNGFVSLIESKWDDNWEAKYADRKAIVKLGDYPFDMHLENVLGVMPKKEYLLQRMPVELMPLEFALLPTAKNINCYLERVLSVMTVGSKRFLTNKVDRCVTGLIAQQQCVGPLHTPLADVAVTAVSHFGYEGIATSIGTQPIKGLINARAGAQMSVAEALSNLVFAGITELADVKCSGNWMWAAKLPGEGAKMYDACKEMCRMMNELNIAVDGGKDSLSMAARVDGGKTIKSPGTLVVSTYAPCPDIRVKVTPDLKSPAQGKTGELVWINIERRFRLGASALAQSLGKQGNDSPELLDTNTLKSAFNVTQKMLREKRLLAGHDISDGGLLVCLVEMAIGGLCGLKIDLTTAIMELGTKAFNTNNLSFEYAPFLALFAEECGWVLEVSSEDLATVLQEFRDAKVPVFHIGQAVGNGLKSKVNISYQGESYLSTTTLAAFKQWERTSFELEKLQMNPKCAEEEYATYDYRTGPRYNCTINPDAELFLKKAASVVRVAVIREEGTNGDREMIAALMKAHFEVHDVTMSDLLNRRTSLDAYRGVVFPGGFSYADTLGSAKGWAASIIYSDFLAPQFHSFKQRPDTFSLGVCNGCQLMSLIGWVGETSSTDLATPKTTDVPNLALLHNKSGRYECRWTTVKIAPSNSIMLRRLAGSTLGCWIAHGEGRFSFRTSHVLDTLKKTCCISLHYCDDAQAPTEVYPMNPNGSVEGIAGVCSSDGRHLAMMPHPERCSEMWQWPYVPANFQQYNKCPWQTMFDDAFAWCLESQVL